jgi:hypothetical protein
VAGFERPLTQKRQTDGGTLLTQATYVYDVGGNRLEKDVWTQASGTTTVSRFAYDGHPFEGHNRHSG